ncbi:hypothetical protein SDC9_162581 [bioreactor metagenome]|uniref:Uncharacterized protein n=1 Tax=bioreactor metagenome TaxID=1076179 RepID=A0A645FLH1_9ZZZZ|nr:hypothetical protein [Oscillospiraceae bacterium]
MKKKLKLRITVFATCILLMFLMVTSALATIYQSTAQVSIGYAAKAVGSKQSLSTDQLRGIVVSYSTSTGSDPLYGAMCTRGDIWIHTRDSANVSPGCSVYLLWDNPNRLTGTFWAEATATGGNHNGYCTAYQDR